MIELRYTPLDQFDQVVWLKHYTLENIDSWLLYISNLEFVMVDRWSPLLVKSSLNSNILDFIGFILFLWLYIILETNNKLTEKVYILFILPIIYLLTGGFFTFWFTDVIFIEILNNYESNYISDLNLITVSAKIVPQIVYGISIDEILITLIFGFLLIGGASLLDEDDFIIGESSDRDIVEEVVAPLFVANLGSSIKENAGLYLKVCTLFSFIITSNLLGRIPYGDTATSSLILTFWVSFSVFRALVSLRISKHGITYFFSLFRPAGCPFPLIFLLIPIEFLSYSFRLVSLAVRLFANRRAGHTLRKVLIGFSYVRFTLGEGFSRGGFLPALVVFILIFLERAVACIQAYIFTILICIYLKDIYVSH